MIGRGVNLTAAGKGYFGGARATPALGPLLDRRTRARDVAAYDAMAAARPLRPPPMPDGTRFTAGRHALARDRALGVVC